MDFNGTGRGAGGEVAPSLPPMRAHSPIDLLIDAADGLRTLRPVQPPVHQKSDTPCLRALPAMRRHCPVLRAFSPPTDTLGTTQRNFTRPVLAPLAQLRPQKMEAEEVDVRAPPANVQRPKMLEFNSEGLQRTLPTLAPALVNPELSQESAPSTPSSSQARNQRLACRILPRSATATGPEPLPQRPLEVVQPAPQPVVPIRQPGPKIDSPDLSETEKRQLIRKMRNREAAARSNHKRKIKHDKLKNELSMIRKQAAVLRDRERLLQEENMRLRNSSKQLTS